jgi:Na+/phosphate symporter
LQAIEENTKKKEDLESISERFAELQKGVDMTTQQNISLDSAEWEEYQKLLKQVIDSSDNLYASYDSEGNLIAKSAE